MTSKQYKLDIFKVLAKLSKKDRVFFSSLSEEEEKTLAPLVLMRWLTGTRNAQQIFFLNELVNPFVFTLAKHKELLIDLMMVCTSGSSQRYYWNKTKGKRTSSMPLTIAVVREYFTYSSIEAGEALPLLDDDAVINCAEQLGRQPDELKQIKKELKNRERASRGENT